MRNKDGISLIEILIALTLVTILFFPMLDLLNSAFMSEYNTRLNVESKENRDYALSRMMETINEASYIYEGTVTIPTPESSYTLITPYDALVVYAPVYDDNGDQVTLNGQFQYEGFAYGLVPSQMFTNDYNDSAYSLIETYNKHYCNGSSIDTRIPEMSSCSTDWTDDATTNLLVEKVYPGKLDGYTTSMIDVSTQEVELAFAAKEGKVYYATDYAQENIDSKHIHSVNIFLRNAP